jgi:hypothetical protein
MIGILLALFDLLCCTLSFAEQTFCFNLGIKCAVGNVIYFSAAAAVAFVISCIIICYGPKPDPCFGKPRYVKDDEHSMQRAPVIMDPEISATKQSPNLDASVTKNSEVVSNNKGNEAQWMSQM